MKTYVEIEAENAELHTKLHLDTIPKVKQAKQSKAKPETPVVQPEKKPE